MLKKTYFCSATIKLCRALNIINQSKRYKYTYKYLLQNMYISLLYNKIHSRYGVCA